MVHLYTGDGKGKTCMAIGQAVRCAGWGRDVVIFSFLKNGVAGENKALAALSHLSFYSCETKHDFFYKLSDREKLDLKQEVLLDYLKALELYKKQQVSMIVLDEFLDVLDLDLLTEQQALDLLCYNSDVELVITGHYDRFSLARYADYHSEVCMKKHPYQNGVLARSGIDF